MGVAALLLQVATELVVVVVRMVSHQVPQSTQVTAALGEQTMLPMVPVAGTEVAVALEQMVL